MRSSMQVWKQAEPLLRSPTSCMKVEVLNHFWGSREKVVFIMGATGTLKSRLSIDLAAPFPAEIINSDNIQLHKGLDIVTNKVTKEEQCGIPHHLLGILNPNADFLTKDFCLTATHVTESILRKRKLPIIAGSSNSYIESLVSDPKYGFGFRFDCCFLWVDVSVPVLHSFVSDRVDKMVKAGLVDEVRAIFDPNSTNYSQGIRRAIGVPELDTYFRAEHLLDEPGRVRELLRRIYEIKNNTCELSCRQLEKIYVVKQLKGWDLNRLDATEAFTKRIPDPADEAWDKLVTRPAVQIVSRFLDSKFGPGFPAKDITTRGMVRSNEQQAVIASTNI